VKRHSSFQVISIGLLFSILKKKSIHWLSQVVTSKTINGQCILTNPQSIAFFNVNNYWLICTSTLFSVLINTSYVHLVYIRCFSHVRCRLHICITSVWSKWGHGGMRAWSLFSQSILIWRSYDY